MQLRRPLAALFTALALFGGGAATLSACGDPAGIDRNDGTSDDTKTDNPSGSEPSDKSEGNLPNNTDPDHGNPEDQNDDTTDPQ